MTSSTTLASTKRRKGGFYLYFLPCKIHSLIFRCTLTSVVLYITVIGDWKLVTEEYRRPAIGQGCYVSFSGARWTEFSKLLLSSSVL